MVQHKELRREREDKKESSSGETERDREIGPLPGGPCTLENKQTEGQSGAVIIRKFTVISSAETTRTTVALGLMD